MKISLIGILGFLYLSFYLLHIINSPDLKTVGFEFASMWYFQLWFYEFLAVFCIIADVFYILIRDKK